MITQHHIKEQTYINLRCMKQFPLVFLILPGQNRYMMAAYLVIIQCDPKLIGYACSEEKFITKKKGFSGA